ncbi:hypothetical protein TNCV_4009401 [Trichonephila clavipes]|nr:hypothetical protein TNCV_4009401 [Trichonephila clavipes]
MPILAPTAPSLSNRREQVIWTRLRLGHTRLTHRHLLLGEPPPYCEKSTSSRPCQRCLFDPPGGCGSPVVKVSDHDRHVMSSRPVPLKNRREGQHAR